MLGTKPSHQPNNINAIKYFTSYPSCLRRGEGYS